MSRVYRSQQQPDFVKQVDPAANPLADAKATRPQGGFFGSQAVPSGSRAISLAENREIQAKRVLEDAQRRAEEIQREAYQAGFQEGERAGQKLAMQKVEPALQMLGSITDAIGKQRDELIKQQSGDLIKVAFLIASRIVHKTIELEPEVIESVVEAALAKVSRQQRVTIHLAPQDLQLLEQLKANGGAAALHSDHVECVADEQIARGGCRIATDLGDIDATIDGQLRVFQGELW